MTPSDLSIDEALALVLADAAPLPVERVQSPALAHGRVLAEECHAALDLPAADTSIMDGYALRSADLRAPAPRLHLRGESAAGHPLARPLAPGEAARIATGAVVPPGADAVVAQEDTARDGDVLRVDLARAGDVRPGHFIRAAASEVRPGELALLYGAGHAALPVHRRPRVAVLCTGDELVPIGAAPRLGQVISTNGLMLAAQIREAGAEPIDLGVAPDDPAATRAALARTGDVDVLLTSGGVSVGDHDHVAEALAALGFAPRFRRVALRPGRPLAFGRAGDRLVFALPGNPASAYVTFELFVRPLLRRLLGRRDRLTRPRRRLVLAAMAEGAGPRAHVVRATVGDDGRATPLPQQRSGALPSLAGHDALLLVPPGVRALPAGAEVDALLLDDR